MKTGEREAKWFDKLTIRFGKLTTIPSEVEGKSFFILLLIILISSISSTAEAKSVYATTDHDAGTSGPYGMRAGQLRYRIDANITNRDVGVIYAAGMREVSTALAYSSYIFTTDDITFFSYADGTRVEVYDSNGAPVPVEPNVLDKGEHTYVDTSQGVYIVAGSNKFAVLTGDATTSGVSGYYAIDADGRGVSREFYTYVPALYGHCEFIVFAYGNGTGVTIQEEVANGVYEDIATFTLDKGKHWANSSLSAKYLHIIADKPVSALTCYDQSYFVPSSNGWWSGTEFYTYLSDIEGWPEDLTVIAYDDGTFVSIKDSNTQELIWEGTLGSGQAHVESYPSGANKYFTITSSKPVTVDVQPWVAMTSNYYQGVFMPDRNGTGVGTELIGPTLDGGYLYILAYKDNTHVDLYNAQTGAWQASYTLNMGQSVNANPGNGLWRIISDKDISAYSGWGYECTADFAPLAFNKKCYLTLTKVDDVNDGDCVVPDVNITYTIDYNYPAGPNLPDYNDVNIIDHLPDEVEFILATGPNWFQPDANTVVWNIGTLHPGDAGSVTLTVKVKPCVEPCITITNECVIESNDVPIGWAYEYTPVCCPTLTKDDVADGNCVGSDANITYSICYDANGYGDTNVVITDFLPDEVDYVSSDPCGTYNPDSNTVTWNIDFPTDACSYVELVVQVNATAEPNGVITNSCELMGDCLNLYAEEDTPTCCPKITKVDDVNDGNCISPGENIIYSICYDSYGYADPNLVIIDSLPNDVDYNSSEPTGAYNEVSHTVTWDISSLPPEANSVTLTVEVNCPKPGSTIINYCEIRSGNELYDTVYEYTSVCCWNGAVIYVDVNANGSNNGTSWEDAYTNLQDALEDANTSAGCKDIWVAAGTYKPDEGAGVEPNDREATFELINGVEIKGGYAGFGEPDPNARDPNNETILSGDINDTGDQNDNSYHVVTGSDTDETAVLDGFTITAGNAVYPNNSGGGMYIVDSNTMVMNCIFRGNSAQYGGGMYNYSGRPTITNCTFTGNSAQYSGGGIYVGGSGYAMMTNCILWDNSPEQILNYGIASVTYSDIQGGWEGEGNIDEDPMLEADGYHHLTLCSPCIDAGTNTPPGGLPPKDIDGEDRIMNGRCVGEDVVDMGADEYYLADCNILACAHCPNPACGATDVPVDTVLSWSPGKYAAFHDVYFGTDETAVTDANRDNPLGVLVSQDQNDNTYDPCGLLELNQRYYWRIDEVNDACEPYLWKGDVWHFRTINYLVVEDFDSYEDDEHLVGDEYTILPVWHDKWSDGINAYLHVVNGATFPELVRDGNSMKYLYKDHLNPYYSEAYADVCDLPGPPSGSDWTASGVKALVLYFYGHAYHSAIDPGNDANEPMYVRLSDGSNEGVVTYGDYGEDPNDLRVEEWHEWNIDLEDFNSAGVDLTNVTRITIGFGDGNNPSPASGQGYVYFEDIRLYTPRCIPVLITADINNDCFVDYKDLKMMIDDWLKTPPSDPNTDLYGDGTIDFKDYAATTNRWLKDDLWPYQQ